MTHNLIYNSRYDRASAVFRHLLTGHSGEKEAKNEIDPAVNSTVAGVGFPLAAFAAGSEDPYFKQWARFKIGSSVALQGTATDGQRSSSFTQTITLKEVKDDYLLLDISRTEKGETITKSNKVDKFAGQSDKVVDEGQSEITLAGKKYKCHRSVLKLFKDGKEMMVFEYWFHPDIPGAAKIVSHPGDGAEKGMGKVEVTQSAVSWVKK